MGVSAETLRLLIEAGLSGEKLLAVVESIERDNAKPKDTAGAERTRRWRERKAEAVAAGDVTRDVTVTRHDGDAPALSLPPSPQTPQPPTHTHPECSTRTRAAAIAKPNGFARFWEAYPNKVAKPAAEKAYAKACREIDHPDPPSVLLEGLERAKKSRAWADGYIPHPTTWLNQGRWADQPAETIPNKAPPHDRTGQNPRNDREARRGVWAEVLAEERGEGIGGLARAG